MHPDFYGTCVASVSFNKMRTDGKVTIKSKPEVVKVVAYVNGKRQALSVIRTEALSAAYRLTKTASHVWIESSRGKTAIKGAVVYE